MSSSAGRALDSKSKSCQFKSGLVHHINVSIAWASYFYLLCGRVGFELLSKLHHNCMHLCPSGRLDSNLSVVVLVGSTSTRCNHSGFHWTTMNSHLSESEARLFQTNKQTNKQNCSWSATSVKTGRTAVHLQSDRRKFQGSTICLVPVVWW
jgi:hypothetical protein